MKPLQQRIEKLLREHLPLDPGHLAGAAARWRARHLRGPEGAALRRVPARAGRGRPPPERRPDRGRSGGRAGRPARLHPGRCPAAHEPAPRLRDRRPGGRADARAQGHARGQGRGRGDRRAQERLRRARDSVGRLHRSRGGLDGADRDAGRRARHRDREGGVSRGSRARARSGSGARRASPSCSSSRAAGACSAPGSSDATRAS